jgi:SAM-dependent methyltransferase
MAAEQLFTDCMERYNFACKIVNRKSVLDAACGSGFSTPLFVEAGAQSYDGVDIDREQIAYANYRYADKAYLNDKVNYHVGDIRTFNNGKTFDVITCFAVIEHIQDYKSVIKNLYGLLNYGGVLLISSPNRMITSPRCMSIDDKPANELHTQEFTPNELLEILMSSGFSISQEKVFGQYQRRLYSEKFLNKIVQGICKKYKKRNAAVVREVKDKVPEHFIIAATKA